MDDVLRLFIWEGNGISEAYHDDGVLIVLAHTVEEARDLMRRRRTELAAEHAQWSVERNQAMEARPSSQNTREFWDTALGRALWARRPSNGHDGEFWDGADESIARDPDRVVELDGPKWVAFNRGGYD